MNSLRDCLESPTMSINILDSKILWLILHKNKLQRMLIVKQTQRRWCLEEHRELLYIHPSLHFSPSRFPEPGWGLLRGLLRCLDGVLRGFEGALRGSNWSLIGSDRLRWGLSMLRWGLGRLRWGLGRHRWVPWRPGCQAWMGPYEAHMGHCGPELALDGMRWHVPNLI